MAHVVERARWHMTQNQYYTLLAFVFLSNALGEGPNAILAAVCLAVVLLNNIKEIIEHRKRIKK